MNYHQKRQDSAFVDPAVEDAGLFKGEIIRVDVTLSPQVHMSVRQDMIVTGYTSQGIGFDVLFAGRRKAAAHWLLSHLADLRADGKRSEDVRVKVQMEGAWRTTFAPDPSGWDARRRQLVAALWTLKTPQGVQTFGERVLR